MRFLLSESGLGIELYVTQIMFGEDIRQFVNLELLFLNLW